VPDVLVPGLRLVFVGINPGRHSAARGHHFAGPQTHFWRLLAESALTPRVLLPEEDVTLPTYGLGITNVVARPSPGEGDLTWTEFRRGGERLRARIAAARPRGVACLGKNVARAYAGLGPSTPVAWGPMPGDDLPAPAFALPNPSSRSTIPYAERLEWFRALARWAKNTG
jgi:G:T/U-mismatch repair DNA glycosylase